jgi:hypothetical protein
MCIFRRQAVEALSQMRATIRERRLHGPNCDAAPTMVNGLIAFATSLLAGYEGLVPESRALPDWLQDRSF